MEPTIYSAPFRIGIPDCMVAKASRIGTEPENEVIAFLENWVAQRGVNLSQSRRFGYDIPVAEEFKTKGMRGYEYLVEVPEHLASDGEVKVEPFPGGKFIALSIADPFADPFQRIPQGWEVLVKHIRENNMAVNWCAPMSCLEEVSEQAGKCSMNVMIRLA